MNQKTIIAVVIGILVVAGAWYYYSYKNTGENNSAKSEVVARVNGEDITRAELEKTENQILSTQGVNIDTLDEATRTQLQTQALDNLISNTLIRQAAEKSGETTTDADVDGQLATIKGQFKDDAEYQTALAAQGLSESELRSNIATDIKVQAYLKKTLPLDSVTATDAEIKTLYDQEASNGGDNLPALSDVSEQIKAFVIQQKQQQLVQTHIQELRTAGEVEVLI